MLESTSALPNIWLLKLMSQFRSRLRMPSSACAGARQRIDRTRPELVPFRAAGRISAAPIPA